MWVIEQHEPPQATQEKWPNKTHRYFLMFASLNFSMVGYKKAYSFSQYFFVLRHSSFSDTLFSYSPLRLYNTVYNTELLFFEPHLSIPLILYCTFLYSCEWDRQTNARYETKQTYKKSIENWERDVYSNSKRGEQKNILLCIVYKQDAFEKMGSKLWCTNCTVGGLQQ